MAQDLNQIVQVGPVPEVDAHHALNRQQNDPEDPADDPQPDLDD